MPCKQKTTHTRKHYVNFEQENILHPFISAKVSSFVAAHAKACQELAPFRIQILFDA